MRKKSRLKAVVMIAQSSLAKIDYLLGRPARKRSKTYIQAYAREYAAGEAAHYASHKTIPF